MFAYLIIMEKTFCVCVRFHCTNYDTIYTVIYITYILYVLMFCLLFLYVLVKDSEKQLVFICAAHMPPS